MSKCGFNIDKDCIETKCHKCKLNPMYQQGRADERIDILNAIKNDLHKLWIEETNKPYTNQGVIEGLYLGIKRCEWYLSNDKEQKYTEEKAKVKAKEEFKKEINSANTQLSLWKSKVTELEQRNLRLSLQIKTEKEARAELQSTYDKTIKALNKEVKSLEADLKRMERMNLMGE